MINLFYPVVVLATSIGLNFGSVPQKIMVGEVFGIPINVYSDTITTLGTDAVIAYDPTVLEVIKVTPGDVYLNYPINLEDIDNVHGKTRFAGTVGFEKPIAVNGLLGKVFFRAKKLKDTQVKLVFKPGGTDDSNIVPDDGRLDLLTEAPQPINLSFVKPSAPQKMAILIKWIFSFDYLQFL